MSAHKGGMGMFSIIFISIDPAEPESLVTFSIESRKVVQL